MSSSSVTRSPLCFDAIRRYLLEAVVTDVPVRGLHRIHRRKRVVASGADGFFGHGLVVLRGVPSYWEARACSRMMLSPQHSMWTAKVRSEGPVLTANIPGRFSSHRLHVGRGVTLLGSVIVVCDRIFEGGG